MIDTTEVVVVDTEDVVEEEEEEEVKNSDDPPPPKTGLSQHPGTKGLRKSCSEPVTVLPESILTGLSLLTFCSDLLCEICRYEDIPVEATGTDVPKGIDTFDDVDLTPIIKVLILLI